MSSILIGITLMGGGMSAAAQTSSAVQPRTIVEGVTADKLKMEQNGDYLAVDMSLGLSGLQVDANRAVLLTPRLVHGSDSTDLAPVGVYGRRRYYFYVRNGENLLTGGNGQTYKASQAPDTVNYHALIPYAEWMNGAVLSLHREDYGCCQTLLAEQTGTLGRHFAERAFFPELVYVRPQGEAVKTRALEGSAFIDFPVNRTEIRPDYRRNAVELGRIQATLDSVYNDRDITITSVWLKGYASPESPYANNRRLAIGRTEALKAYIARMYRFADGVISTAHEPEDWEGLRRFVDRSQLEHRMEILALIDGDLEPDAKEAAIKRAYPEEYRHLLQHSYPALRHTDYRIAYTIRTYTDVEEIKRVLRERPQKLGLNEFYLAAADYEPGTDEFTEVFETAVRMFPEDETANLNAANAAMRRNDLKGAERYLTHAGEGAEAVYARAALAIRRKEYPEARRLLNEARKMGLKQAEITLQELDERIQGKQFINNQK